MYFAQVLPIELIFFNTHGAGDAIILDGLPLYNHLLVQWIDVHSYPLVINNSCLSWIGVGREFLRVGARGYIGTLWSVDAVSAADFARRALQSMVLEGQLAATAIASFVGSEPDSRALYIFGDCKCPLVHRSLFLWHQSERGLIICSHLRLCAVSIDRARRKDSDHKRTFDSVL
jgi:hypothetical protein